MTFNYNFVKTLKLKVYGSFDSRVKRRTRLQLQLFRESFFTQKSKYPWLLETLQRQQQKCLVIFHQLLQLFRFWRWFRRRFVAWPLLDHQILQVWDLLLISRHFRLFRILLPDEDRLAHAREECIAASGKLKWKIFNWSWSHGKKQRKCQTQRPFSGPPRFVVVYAKWLLFRGQINSVHNNHTRGHKSEAVVDRWLLLKGQ